MKPLGVLSTTHNAFLWQFPSIYMHDVQEPYLQGVQFQSTRRKTIKMWKKTKSFKVKSYRAQMNVENLTLKSRDPLLFLSLHIQNIQKNKAVSKETHENVFLPAGKHITRITLRLEKSRLAQNNFHLVKQHQIYNFHAASRCILTIYSMSDRFKHLLMELIECE